MSLSINKASLLIQIHWMKLLQSPSRLLCFPVFFADFLRVGDEALLFGIVFHSSSESEQRWPLKARFKCSGNSFDVRCYFFLQWVEKAERVSTANAKPGNFWLDERLLSDLLFVCKETRERWKCAVMWALNFSAQTWASSFSYSPF